MVLKIPEIEGADFLASLEVLPELSGDLVAFLLVIVRESRETKKMRK